MATRKESKKSSRIEWRDNNEVRNARGRGSNGEALVQRLAREHPEVLERIVKKAKVDGVYRIDVERQGPSEYDPDGESDYTLHVHGVEIGGR